MEAGYSIRQLSDEFGVTARTLRHYEHMGLIHPQRNKSARIYTSRDRARLKVALRSKRLGFSLQEIRELFELYDGAGGKPQQLEIFLGRLERKRAALEQQREDLDVMLSEIQFFSEQCRRLLRGDGGIKVKPTDLTFTST